jgi:signal transduction histidine kinase
VRPLWPPRSLSIKLGLVLFALVAAALAIVYAAVVPRLENRIVSATYNDLRQNAFEQRPNVPSLVQVVSSTSGFEYQTLVDNASVRLNVRVVIFKRLALNTPLNVADSNRVSPLRDDLLVRKALSTRAVQQGRLDHGDTDYAELAVPVDGVTVLLLAAPLSERLAAIHVVRRDILVAGSIGLAVCWIVGAVLAVRFTRRIRRLETAAERIADGDFEAAIVDCGNDEVAELARAFDQMRMRLAQLDRARREFIANASHELRTPLFALGGFLELLSDEDLDESTRRDFLETARGQVERLTRLATDLLDLSRLDADQVGMASEPVDLGETAGQIAEEFGPLAETSGHTLSVHDSGEVVALADRERVLQIGRSLVENALRHTGRGTSVELRTAVFVDRAELAVADNGPGIAPDDQERVFERFFRAQGAAAFGSGIGLAIARELAQRMGGTIELRSQPGRTVFTLVLPRAPSAAPFSRENALV